ncbi:unnamed protein product [Sphagnum compactum]
MANIDQERKQNELHLAEFQFLQSQVPQGDVQMHTRQRREFQAEKIRLEAEVVKSKVDDALMQQAQGLHICRSRHQRLKSMIVQKSKELKKFRHLAQRVLQQRSEVELFLIDSINLVKHIVWMQTQKSHTLVTHMGRQGNGQFSKENNKSKLYHNIPTPILPAIPSCSWPGVGPWPQVQPSFPYDSKYSSSGKTHLENDRNLQKEEEFARNVLEHEIDSQLDILDDLDESKIHDKVLPKVDISELSWTDREKVLRYLFKKINISHQIPNKNNSYSSKKNKSSRGIA